MKHASIIFAAALLGHSAATLHSAEAPLLTEAEEQFKSMTTTLYQHKTEVDRTTGSYRYDCVGFVSYALKHAAPQAWASAFKATGIDKGRDWSEPGIRTLIRTLNAIRRGNPALRQFRNLQFTHSENDLILAYAKVANGNRLLIIVNLDAWHPLRAIDQNTFHLLGRQSWVCLEHAGRD